MSDAPEFLEAVSSEGQRVLEADLAHEHELDGLLRAGREHEADALWIHTDIDLTAHGFERFPGYARLRSEHPPSGLSLPQLSRDRYAATLDGAFRGLWGHKLVSPQAEPSPSSIVLGLDDEHGEPIGLCIVFPDERLVDGPGVVQGSRAPAAYERLLLGACAELGSGAIDLDSWGDPDAVIESYQALGFDIVERTGGWQLRLE